MARWRMIMALMCLGIIAICSVTHADTDLELVAKIDTAVARAVKFLASKQSPDGAWRSDVYAPFKEGDALTPLVMTALLPLPIDDDTEPMRERGMQYLVELSKRTFENPDGLKSLAYPVYTAANITIPLHQSRRAEDEAIRAKWLQALRDLQITEATGWSPQDLQYGGWGYGHTASSKPDQGKQLGPLDEPNMSATTFAMVALHAAGITDRDPTMRKALRFITGLQNYDSAVMKRAYKPDPRGWDDQGFFFVHYDEVRNKAGKVGTDDRDRLRNSLEPNQGLRSTESVQDPARFASYGAPTADGLRCLLICQDALGQLDQPRTHAMQWLEKSFRAGEHPGKYPPQREATKNALYFYFMASYAQGLRQAGRSDWLSKHEFSHLVAEMASDLLQRQSPDGSWRNDTVDQREDDPLVATPFAIQSLSALRTILVNVKKIQPEVSNSH